MYTVLTVIHILAALVMIGVILLQQGKGADMGAVFGGSSQTLFGSSGAGNFLTRTTAGVAALFFATSLALAYGSASRVTTTIFDDAPLADTESSGPAPGGAPAPEGGAPAPQPAPQAQAEPQAHAEPAGEAAPIKVTEPDTAQVIEETAKESAENLDAEAKEAGAAVAGAADAAAADVKAGAEDAAKDAEKAAQDIRKDAQNAADAMVTGGAEEAPGQADPVPPVAP